MLSARKMGILGGGKKSKETLLCTHVNICGKFAGNYFESTTKGKQEVKP